MKENKNIKKKKNKKKLSMSQLVLTVWTPSP